MMYPRLKVARNLLKDNGVIRISVDDGEVNLMKSITSEIFGEENFLSILIWNKQHSQQQGMFKKYHECVLVYAKDEDALPEISGGQGVVDTVALKRISQGNPASEFTFPRGVRFNAAEGVEIKGTFGESEKVTVASGRFICKDKNHRRGHFAGGLDPEEANGIVL